MTRGNKFIGLGSVGAVVTALCCFTPVLVIALGAFGLSALVGWWLDLILFPALGGFLGLLLYGLYLRKRNADECSAAGEAAPESRP